MVLLRARGQPLLDEAMHALDETDRAAVLLRYFENKSLREVGQTLGTSENAAQKRLNRAVERLREFFAKRGVTAGASGLVVVISGNAVQAAHVGLALSISTATALAGTTIATTAIATEAILMTTLQKPLVTAALVAAIGAAIYEVRQVAGLREQNESLERQQASFHEQIQQSQRERVTAISRLAALSADLAQEKKTPAELMKLRGQVGVLRQEKADIGSKSGVSKFTELVRRHVDFAYSATLRMVRDTHLAEDSTQMPGVGGFATAHVGERADLSLLLALHFAPGLSKSLR